MLTYIIYPVTLISNQNLPVNSICDQHMVQVSYKVSSTKKPIAIINFYQDHWTIDYKSKSKTPLDYLRLMQAIENLKNEFWSCYNFNNYILP